MNNNFTPETLLDAMLRAMDSVLPGVKSMPPDGFAYMFTLPVGDKSSYISIMIPERHDDGVYYVFINRNVKSCYQTFFPDVLANQYSFHRVSHSDENMLFTQEWHSGNIERYATNTISFVTQIIKKININ